MASHTNVAVDAGTPVRVTAASGSIEVIAEARGDVLVEEGADDVARTADALEVRGGSDDVRVRVPAGTDLVAGTDSGSVTLEGELGNTLVSTGSGTIRVDTVSRLDARTGSGNIEVEVCAGECRCQSGSGKLRVGSAGSAELVAASGNVEAERVGDAHVRAGSGNVSLGLSALGDVSVEAHSGNVTVDVPSGLHPTTDLKARSGKVRCECEPGSDGSISVRAESGNITVTER